MEDAVEGIDYHRDGADVHPVLLTVMIGLMVAAPLGVLAMLLWAL